MKRTFLVLLLGALLLASCERVPVENKPDNGTPPQSLTAPAGPTSLFQRVADSRETLGFQGVRRVEMFVADGVAQQHIVLRERVSADGQGHFAIEALEVIDPPMGHAQHDVFLSMQFVRQGMNWRYRDFGINVLALFLQNYRAVETGSSIVAGETCIDFDIDRQDGSGPQYRVAVHALNGLVLHAREESREGVLISEMSFETIDLAPDLDGVAWHQPSNNETELPISGSVLAEVGFEPRSPRSLPAGYQLIERSRLLHPQDQSPWVKATFGDGVENLFFLHGGPIVGGNGIQSGSPVIEADLVEVLRMAPWIVAQGNLRLERVIAMGKVSEQDLLELVRSAME